MRPQALYKHNCLLLLHLPQLLPEVTAAKPGCSQPETRALFPQDTGALASTFQDSLLCTQHFSCPLSTAFATQNTTWLALPSAHPKHRQREEAGAGLRPCPGGETRRVPSLWSHLVGFLTGSEAGAVIPQLWGPEPHLGSQHCLTAFQALAQSHV